LVASGILLAADALVWLVAGDNRMGERERDRIAAEDVGAEDAARMTPSLRSSAIAVMTLSVTVSCGGPAKKSTFRMPPPRVPPPTVGIGRRAMPSACPRLPVTSVRTIVSRPPRLAFPPPTTRVREG
jgi:hypothetical protein